MIAKVVGGMADWAGAAPLADAVVGGLGELERQAVRDLDAADAFSQAFKASAANFEPSVQFDGAAFVGSFVLGVIIIFFGGNSIFGNWFIFLLEKFRAAREADAGRKDLEGKYGGDVSDDQQGGT